MVRITINPTSIIRGLYRCPRHAEEQAEWSYSQFSFGAGAPRHCPGCGKMMRLVELEVTDA